VLHRCRYGDRTHPIGHARRVIQRVCIECGYQRTLAASERAEKRLGAESIQTYGIDLGGHAVLSCHPYFDGVGTDLDDQRR
jgi:hypothetical protein